MLRGMSRVLLAPCAALALAIALAGCPGDPELTCVADVDFATCAPLYAPTWHNVYTNTIVDSCASSRACHGGTSASSGLTLVGEEAAYTRLRAYVTPGDAACSELVERLYTSSDELLMPRGARLPDPERCAIGQWVAAGAPGPAGLVDAGVDGAAP